MTNSPTDKRNNPKLSPHKTNTVNIDTNLLILFSGIFLGCILLISYILGSISLYRTEISESQDNLNRVAFILSEQTALAFHEIDTVIKESRSFIQTKTWSDTSEEALHQQLHNIFQGFLQGQALLLFGPDGKMRAHSREFPTPPVTVSDRPYFRAHADKIDDTLYIASPTRNRVNNNWMISLSRRLSTPQGDFGGVIMAAVEMNYFNQLYRALELPPEATIRLVRNDGTLLATYPLDESQLGAVVSLTTNPEDALCATYRVGDLPLAISLTIPRAVALRRWHSLVWILGPGALTAVIGIGILTGTLLFLVKKDRLKTLSQKKYLEEQIRERTFSLQDILEFNKKIIDTSPVGIGVYRYDGKCISINDVFSQTLQIDKQKLLTHTLMELKVLQPSGLLDSAAQTLQTGTTTSREGYFLTVFGKKVWIDYQIVRFSRNNINHLLLISNDITERKQMEEELRTLAFTDSLTGVNNRRRFLELAQSEIERVKRTGRPFAFLSLDIDHFKNINDTHGHDQGDIVLQRLAAICLNTLRTNDVFGRLGGEEFGAILIETTGEAAVLVAERLRTIVAGESLTTAGGSITFTISIGVSLCQGSCDSIDSIMQRADKALYAAKNQGRNRVVHA